jgi:NACalpha-BTF3-like transcription factor
MTYVCTPPSPCHAQACGIASHAQLMGMTKEDMRAAGVSVAVRTHLLKASAQYRPPPASSGDGPGDGGGREADARTETEIAVPAAVAAPAANTADIDFVVQQTGVDRTRAAAALDRHQEPAAAILAIEDEQKAERARAQPPLQLEARQASTTMDQTWFAEVWEKIPAKVKESPDIMAKTLSSLQVELL